MRVQSTRVGLYLEEISERGMIYCEANNVASWYAHCRLFYIWSKARLESPHGRDREMRDPMMLVARGNQLGPCLFRIALAGNNAYLAARISELRASQDAIPAWPALESRSRGNPKRSRALQQDYPAVT